MLKQPACFSALPKLRKYLSEYQEIDGALHFINAPYKIGDRTEISRKLRQNYEEVFYILIFLS